jgi:hypothetical protein
MFLRIEYLLQYLRCFVNIEWIDATLREEQAGKRNIFTLYIWTFPIQMTKTMYDHEIVWKLN